MDKTEAFRKNNFRKQKILCFSEGLGFVQKLGYQISQCRRTISSTVG